MWCDELVHDREQGRQLEFERYSFLRGAGGVVESLWLRGSSRRDAGPEDSFEPFIYTWIALNAWAECVSGEERDSRWVRALSIDPQLGDRFRSCAPHQDSPLRVHLAEFAAFWPIPKVQDWRRGVLTTTHSSTPSLGRGSSRTTRFKWRPNVGWTTTHEVNLHRQTGAISCTPPIESGATCFMARRVPTIPSTNRLCERPFSHSSTSSSSVRSLHRLAMPGAVSNMAVKLPVRPVTARAKSARAAPVRSAAYGRR